MPEEMNILREILTNRGIKWSDRSDKPGFPLLDLAIYRTRFNHNGVEWSVISGFGTYGGDKGLLEVMIGSGDPVGHLTAADVVNLMDKGVRK